VAGASTIIAVDLHANRLALAEQLGATHVIEGAAEDLVGAIQAITGGGANYALDTTGVPAVILKALASLRMAGKCGLVGIQNGDLVLDGLALVGKTVYGILEGGALPHQFIPRMIELWQDGRFPFDRLVQTFPLSAINEAEQASLSGKVIKPVLLPGG
jgi:aryl-alcohol dehydrogenase